MRDSRKGFYEIEMMGLLWKLGRRSLFTIDPERAHNFAITAIKYGTLYKRRVDNNVLHLSIANLDFPNPLGIAAGFDKNAKVADALLKLGFGFIEIGTVTPFPQNGNNRPRMFRLPQDKAIINRMGFNNEGYDVVYSRLSKCRKRRGIVGINIGANKDSDDRVADYVKGINCFYDVSDYFTINVSSPNTPGLRAMQERENLRQLLEAIFAVRDRKMIETKRFCPVFLKIAPDLTEKELDDIAGEILSSKLDGLVVSNTTVSRIGLVEHRRACESGGLSGMPLFQRSTATLAKMRKRLGREYPLIGVGGIIDTATALEKIMAGADLLQLYSGLIYRGSNMVTDLLKGFISICCRDGVNNIAEYRDQNLEKWANRNIEL